MKSPARSLACCAAAPCVRAFISLSILPAMMLPAAMLPGCSSSLLSRPSPRLHAAETATEKSAEASAPPAAQSIDTARAPAAPPAEDGASSAPASDREAPELDFALAFADSESIARQESLPAPAPAEPAARIEKPLPPSSAPAQGFMRVPARMIRVALRRGISQLSLYSVGAVNIGAPGLERRLPARGRIAIQAGRAPASVRIDAGPSRSKEFALPCTLMSQDGYSFFDLDGASYRGSIVLTAQDRGRFMALNVIDVEEYLRGVVDLEIGARAPEEIEAVKAQAIAARTYAYRRMADRRAEPFDVLPTIDDQVYGGVTAESRQSERAVRETADEVLAYGDSLINAYYHSTCGGTTANVNDVWDKPAMPYLVSMGDTDGAGAAYCSFSPSYRWSESWTPAQLSAILARTLAGGGCSGALVDIRVESRFVCGRVRSCRISLSHGACLSGGDAVRFVLRRPGKDRPILRSANFSVASINARQAKITGAGYGHGVGMCQMGAVGRARAGQSCEEILNAYYRGTRLLRIAVEDDAARGANPISSTPPAPRR